MRLKVVSFTHRFNKYCTGRKRRIPPLLHYGISNVAVSYFFKALRSKTGSCALACGSEDVVSLFNIPQGSGRKAAFTLGYSLVAPAGALGYRPASSHQNFKPANTCSTVSGYSNSGIALALP